MSRPRRRLPIGAEVQPDGGTHFRVWAPAPQDVSRIVQHTDGSECTVALERESGGYYSALVPEVGAGTRYWSPGHFRLARRGRVRWPPAPGAGRGTSSRGWTPRWTTGSSRRSARASFNRRFWYDAGGYLYDVVDGEQGDDPACRPNQSFAISLDHPVLDHGRWRPVFDVVEQRLLTPVGLRSLAPGHRDYRPQYYGDLRARDAAFWALGWL